MKEMVFLLEEESAKAFLQTLLPRFLDERITVRTIAFDGKQDLEKQLVKRLQGYINPQARFLVLRDQDSDPDCRKVKKKLVGLCVKAGRGSESVVRIACRELETIYLADLQSVAHAYSIESLAGKQHMKKYRAPDVLESPSRELDILTGGAYQKIAGSRMLGRLVNLQNERSPSFKNLISGICRLEAELLALPE